MDQPTGAKASDARRDLVGQVLRCYPVTVVVLAPYVLLILPMAAFYRNPETGFIVSLVGARVYWAASPWSRWRAVLGAPDPRWDEGSRRAHARFSVALPIDCRGHAHQRRFERARARTLGGNDRQPGLR